MAGEVGMLMFGGWRWIWAEVTARLGTSPLEHRFSLGRQQPRPAKIHCKRF